MNLFFKRRTGKIICGLVLALLAWAMVVGVKIWGFGNKNGAVKSDCIIVLGAAVNGDQPSPVFEARITHAIDLFEMGLAEDIIFTGGFGDQAKHSESAVGAAYAVTHGVKQSAILIEENSRTTHQNLLEAKSLMNNNEWKSAIIVSDPLHLKRASVMASDMDLSVVTSPTPTSRYRSLKTKSSFLIREIFFYNYYMIIGH